MSQETLRKTIDTKGRLDGDIAVEATLQSRDGNTTMQILPVSRATEVHPPSETHLQEFFGTSFMKDVTIHNGAVAYPVICVAPSQQDGKNRFLAAFFNPNTEELTIEAMPYTEAYGASFRASCMADDFVKPKDYSVFDEMFAETEKAER